MGAFDFMLNTFIDDTKQIKFEFIVGPDSGEQVRRNLT